MRMSVSNDYVVKADYVEADYVVKAVQAKTSPTRPSKSNGPALQTCIWA